MPSRGFQCHFVHALLVAVVAIVGCNTNDGPERATPVVDPDGGPLDRGSPFDAPDRGATSTACTAGSVSHLVPQTDDFDMDDPHIVWAGDEFGVFWRDNRDWPQIIQSRTELYFMRVGADGVPRSQPTRVTTLPSPPESEADGVWEPTIAWDGTQYVAVYQRLASLERLTFSKHGTVAGPPEAMLSPEARDPIAASSQGHVGVAWTESLVPQGTPSCTDQCWYARQQVWFTVVPAAGPFIKPSQPIDEYQLIAHAGPDGERNRPVHLVGDGAGGFSVLWVRQVDDAPPTLRRARVDSAGAVAGTSDFAIADVWFLHHAVIGSDLAVAWQPFGSSDVRMFVNNPSTDHVAASGLIRGLFSTADGLALLWTSSDPQTLRLALADSSGHITSQYTGPAATAEGMQSELAHGPDIYGMAWFGREHPSKETGLARGGIWFNSFKCGDVAP